MADTLMPVIEEKPDLEAKLKKKRKPSALRRGRKGRPPTFEFEPQPDVPLSGIQDGEPTEAFADFVFYRDLGRGRTIRQAAENAGKSEKHMQQLSARWGWQLRVHAWDDELDQVRKEVHKKSAAESAAEMREMVESMWTLAAKGLKQHHDWIDHLSKDSTKDNPIRPVYKARDLKSLAETGVKLSQLLEGEPTEINGEKDLTVSERRKKLRQLAGDPEARQALALISGKLSQNGRDR